MTETQRRNVLKKRVRQFGAQVEFFRAAIEGAIRGAMQCSVLGALALMGISGPSAMAQDGHSHNGGQQQEQLTAEQLSQRSELIQLVRLYTDKYQDFKQAQKDNYLLGLGCVSGSDQGAMGLHFINMNLVKLGVIDVAHPQIILYEPTADGKLKLTGADFLVDAEQWDNDKTHVPGPPELMGQLFHYFEAPNRFGLKAFYTLHVWAWKDNPNGAFVNWHPDVACKLYDGKTGVTPAPLPQ
jgi:hypothetical protein